MILSEARRRNKLAQFIKEHEKDYPHTRKYRFRTVVKLMALNRTKKKSPPAITN